MRWFEYTIETTTQGEEIVTYELGELGITNVEVIDNIHEEDMTQGGDFEELLPDDMQPDDGSAKVRFYLNPDTAEEDRKTILENLKEALEQYRNAMDIGPCNIVETFSDEADWRDKWKEFFHEFRVASFHVRPAWEAGKVTDLDNTILIDPGTAFGTGKHESTMLCIEGMEKYMKEGDSVFDVGFGSGILSVAAEKKKAGTVCGTDIADDALESAKSNFSLNGLKFKDDRFKIGDITYDEELFFYMMKKTTEAGVDSFAEGGCKNDSSDANTFAEGGYDLVLANLLADIILGMTDRLFSLTKKGGILITSGIIDFRAADVEEQLKKSGFSILEVRSMGEWRSIVAKSI